MKKFWKGVDKCVNMVYNVDTTKGNAQKERKKKMKKRFTMRELLLSAVAVELNCSEECLKRYKTYQLQEMLEKLDEKQTEGDN